MSDVSGEGGTTTTTTTMTSFRTILEKPLSQLTEDDISQLTREDCRNYLKEKGMRRPSWNKSQAIQQVISLKALLEPNDDSAAALLRKIVGSPPQHPPAVSNSTDSAKNAQGVNSAVEPVPPQHKKEMQKPEQAVKAVKAVTPSKNQCTAESSIRQMTIFYSGKEQVKIKKSMGPTSTLEIYLNQEFRRHPSNEDSSRSSTGSPPQLPGLLQVANNQIHCLPVDLNENEILDAEQY